MKVTYFSSPRADLFLFSLFWEIMVDLQFRDEHSSIDRISILPDELLAFILSFLTLKEAAATSILSHRWRYLWIFIPKLDFDGTEFLVKVISKETESELALYDERWNYVGWVDDVIALHEGCTIEELRVFFNLTKTHKKHIDRWLRFALARKVERLELNLVNIGCRMSRKYDECYTFPYELLRNRSSSVSMRKCDSIDFRYLRRISMRYVNVNGEALEFFLCNCPFLEHLSVSQSGELSTLKIIGPFPSFKRLEICMCYNLNSVEIRDANLVYLKYKGKRIRHFLLENVPMLVEILVGGVLTYSMEDVLLMLSSCLPQLERFTMERLRMFSGKETRMFCSSVKMSNLKQLVVKSRGLCADSYVDSLIPLTNFILASPFLQRFVLEVSHWKPKFVKRIIASGIVRSYPHLKKVEFTGYRGGTNEQELVLHFLENAVALKEILIDPRERENCLSHVWNCYYNSFKGKIIEDEMNAIRARAREQLTKRVPPGVNLKIL